MLHAMEQIRRMRGGAQAHLMRCSDAHYYVVKFQNNPQHRRVLVNELLGTRLARRLGLPTAPVAIVEVGEQLIRLTEELRIELPLHRVPCTAGPQFGSRYPGNPRRLMVNDFLADEDLSQVENVDEFAGMLVFDKWTCNTDGRQTVFFKDKRSRRSLPPDTPGQTDKIECLPQSALPSGYNYQTIMIDQGFCFNAGDWDFPDAPLRGLYARNVVYQNVTGMKSFEPWLERLEKEITERVLDEESRDIPPEWYGNDYAALYRLLEQLYRRRSRVPELLLQAQRSNRQPFAYWLN